MAFSSLAAPHNGRIKLQRLQFKVLKCGHHHYHAENMNDQVDDMTTDSLKIPKHTHIYTHAC